MAIFHYSELRFLDSNPCYKDLKISGSEKTIHKLTVKVWIFTKSSYSPGDNINPNNRLDVEFKVPW